MTTPSVDRPSRRTFPVFIAVALDHQPTDTHLLMSIDVTSASPLPSVTHPRDLLRLFLAWRIHTRWFTCLKLSGNTAATQLNKCPVRFPE
jgi:hypothetical protein